MPTRFEIAKPDIVASFDQVGQKILDLQDIQKILSENRQAWRLAQATTTEEFIEFIKAKGKLQEHRIDLPFRPTSRFTWGDATTFEIVQSLNPAGYFSHYSAIYLHGLTEQIPKTIYFNIEQRASGGGGSLTQESINRAFRGKCRVTTNTTAFRDRTIYSLNGQNTQRLGVIDFSSSEGNGLRVTNVERTLIDATVRTVYAGGVAEVAGAFQAAQKQVSINRLVSYLKKLNFTYPYHQAIGYYLERSGNYTESQLAHLRKIERKFDFYLTYQLKETAYIKAWRLYVPKGF